MISQDHRTFYDYRRDACVSLFHVITLPVLLQVIHLYEGTRCYSFTLLSALAILSFVKYVCSLTGNTFLFL